MRNVVGGGGVEVWVVLAVLEVIPGDLLGEGR